MDVNYCLVRKPIWCQCFLLSANLQARYHLEVGNVANNSNHSNHSQAKNNLWDLWPLHSKEYMQT